MITKNYSLNLQHDNWLRKVIIGIKLALSQDDIIYVYSCLQHINTLIENKEALGDGDFLVGIKDQSNDAIKFFDELFE